MTLFQKKKKHLVNRQIILKQIETEKEHREFWNWSLGLNKKAKTVTMQANIWALGKVRAMMFHAQIHSTQFMDWCVLKCSCKHQVLYANFFLVLNSIKRPLQQIRQFINRGESLLLAVMLFETPFKVNTSYIAPSHCLLNILFKQPPVGSENLCSICNETIKNKTTVNFTITIKIPACWLAHSHCL